MGCDHAYTNGRQVEVQPPGKPLWIIWCPQCRRGRTQSGHTGLVEDPGSRMILDGRDETRSLASQQAAAERWNRAHGVR